MKRRTEIRILFAMLALLVALSVPAAAEAFQPEAPPPASIPAATGVSQAGSGPWLASAPPPLLLMLLGTLVVAVTVTRHIRGRRGAAPARSSFHSRPSLPSAR